MNGVKRLTPPQSRKINALVRRTCCNYDNGNCILLDDGDECVCPQLISYSLLCKWFRVAVLPADRLLYADPYTPEQVKLLMQRVEGTVWEMPVILGGLYGMRRSEILGLRWRNVDLENNTFDVTEQLPFKVPPKTKVIEEMAPPKSNGRKLPITELDAYHSAVGKADPPKAKEAEPKKAKGKAKKKSTDLEL